MELIYTLTDDEKQNGLKSRTAVHADGTLHLSVQCWVMNETGHILIQRRSATKDKSAGKWDVSFGGHCTEVPNRHDILIENVIKEGWEELGLTVHPDDLIKLGDVRYTSQGGKNRELIGVFLLRVPDTQTFVFKDGEVSEIRWTTAQELHRNITTNTAEYANRLGALSLLQTYLTHV